MKLIDILVQELPKVGGWPREVDALVQSSEGAVYKAGGGFPVMFNYLADDWELAEVTREQYEAAMQHSVWNGEGLPPVGCECELFDSESGWETVVIKFIGNKTAVVDTEDGEEYSFELSTCDFRPIRSEDEQNREEAITRLQVESQSEHWQAPISASQAINIYDAIAAGKIPHIQIK